MTWPRGEMCDSCAGRRGTEANCSAETMATFAECIAPGEPFYCHESTAELDQDGLATDRHGTRYRRLPQSRWRLCRAWMAAQAAKETDADARHASASVAGDARRAKAAGLPS